MVAGTAGSGSEGEEMYVGYGVQRGKRINDEEAFEYAARHLQGLGRQDWKTLKTGLLRDRWTCEDFTEWFFSGSFIHLEEEENVPG